MYLNNLLKIDKYRYIINSIMNGIKKIIVNKEAVIK